MKRDKIRRIIREEINKVALLSEREDGKPLIGYVPVGEANYYDSTNKVNKKLYILMDTNPREEWMRNKKLTTMSRTKDGSSGSCDLIDIDIMPFQMSDVEYTVYPEYLGTKVEDEILGPRRDGEKFQNMHKELLAKLDIQDNGNVLLKHDSFVRITDGYVKRGRRNIYSKGTVNCIYFWGSRYGGYDQSNGGTYTYYCEANPSDIYDFYADMERNGTLERSLRKHSFVATMWSRKTAVVVCTGSATPIKFIYNRNDGKYYTPDWEEIDKEELKKRYKSIS